MRVDNFDLDEALTDAYSQALKEIRAKTAEFMWTWSKVLKGEIKPPAYYVQNGLEDYWKKGFLNELARKNHVSRTIINEINRAGKKSAGTISRTLFNEYGHGYQGELRKVRTQAV